MKIIKNVADLTEKDVDFSNVMRFGNELFLMLVLIIIGGIILIGVSHIIGWL